MKKFLVILLAIFNILPISAKSDTILVRRPYVDDQTEYFLRCGNKVSIFSIRVNKYDKSCYCLDIITDISRTIKLSYSQQMYTTERVIKDICKHYRRPEILIRFEAQDWGDESVIISNNFQNIRKNMEPYAAMEMAIKQSKLYKDLSKILSKYSYSISKFGPEKLCTPSIDIFLNESVVHHKIDGKLYSALITFVCDSNSSSMQKRTINKP